MRWSITGTTISDVHPCRAISDSVASGSNLRSSTIVVERPIASVKCAKPQAWNSGAAIIARLARAQRDVREQRRGGVERLRLPAARALGRARRAGGEDHGLALLGRRREVGAVAVPR